METETLRNLSNVLLVVGLVAGAAGTFGVNHFRGRLEKERETAAKIKEKAAKKHAASLQANIDDLVAGKNALLAEIQGYQRDLLARDERIRELERSAKAAKRGVVDRYDFNGARRIQSGGTANLEVGEEYVAFQQMVALEKDGNDAALVPLCEKQIQTTPEWLTPYLFLGFAYARMGNREKAIVNLQHVVAHAGGDAEYKPAEELLNRIMASP